MKLNGSDGLEEAMTTHVKAYSLSDPLYQRITGDGLFNFTELHFEQELPESIVEAGIVMLLSRRPLSVHLAQLEDLQQAEYSILSFQIDGQIYYSIYGLMIDCPQRIDYDFLVNLVTKRVRAERELNEQEAKRIKASLVSYLTFAHREPLKSDDLVVLLERLMVMARQVMNYGERMQLVEGFLKEKGIPVERDKDAYHFDVTMNGESWSSELLVSERSERIVLYSSVHIEGLLEEQALLKELNERNAEQRVGNFELISETGVLCFKNVAYLAVKNIEGVLGVLFEDNFRAMISIIKRIRTGNLAGVSWVQ